MISKLNELTLAHFIRCAADDELHLLVKEGEATQEQLHEAWTHLLGLYYEATGNFKMSRYVKLKHRVNKLADRITRVNDNITALQIVPNILLLCPEGAAAIIAELKSEGHHHKYTPESLMGDIKRIVAKEKGNKYEMDKLIAELQRMDTGEEQKATEEGFYQTLFNINKVEGTTYKAAELNMQEYCVLVKRLEQHIERLKQQE